MSESETSVLIEDEFLRDGLQNEERLFSVEEKLDFLGRLETAGVKRIQVGSFVHPRLVPQMANTDEFVERIDPKPGVTYTALVLNDAGLRRALAVGLKHLSISISASEAHSQRNLNRSVSEALTRIVPVIELAVCEGVQVRAGIQSALGCAFEGQISAGKTKFLAQQFVDMGVHEINIADTAGLGNPRQVADLCGELTAAFPNTAFSLHLHDTRGLGLANMYAGLDAGIRTFDAALGGLGGCPFVPDASGNIATEDAAYLCEELGFETGIDWSTLRGTVLEAETLLGRSLPGKASHVPVPPWKPGQEAA